MVLRFLSEQSGYALNFAGSANGIWLRSALTMNDKRHYLW
jgi:hypothetical protein